MGTTATSLHILRSSGNTASLSGEIDKAYRRLGYTRPKTPAGISAKQVILVGRDDDDFLSIYDSDNDEIDTGELKDLGGAAVEAARLGRSFASLGYSRRMDPPIRLLGGLRADPPRGCGNGRLVPVDNG
jgi:hypothetical protein